MTRPEEAAPVPAEIPADILQLRLFYDESIGLIIWRSRPQSDFPNELCFQSWRGRFEGRPAFCRPIKDGYLGGEMTYNGRRFSLRAHRVAYALHYGQWPSDEIDHINGLRADNRIANLRVVTRQQNLWNARKPIRSLPRGVRRSSNGFYAEIRVNDRTLRSSYFPTSVQAQAAYVDMWRDHRSLPPEEWAVGAIRLRGEKP